MSISLESLKEAVQIKENIAALEARLEKLLPRGGGGDAPNPFIKTLSAPLVKKSRKKMSKAARARISTAQKTRWAKQKGTSAAKMSYEGMNPWKLMKSAKPSKKEGGLTAEGRARLAAIMKARWAKRKKSGGPALNARKKK